MSDINNKAEKVEVEKIEVDYRKRSMLEMALVEVLFTHDNLAVLQNREPLLVELIINGKSYPFTQTMEHWESQEAKMIKVVAAEMVKEKFADKLDSIQRSLDKMANAVKNLGEDIHREIAIVLNMEYDEDYR